MENKDSHIKDLSFFPSIHVNECINCVFLLKNVCSDIFWVSEMWQTSETDYHEWLITMK